MPRIKKKNIKKERFLLGRTSKSKDFFLIFDIQTWTISSKSTRNTAQSSNGILTVTSTE